MNCPICQNPLPLQRWNNGTRVLHSIGNFAKRNSDLIVRCNTSVKFSNGQELWHFEKSGWMGEGCTTWLILYPFRITQRPRTKKTYIEKYIKKSSDSGFWDYSLTMPHMSNEAAIEYCRKLISNE